MQKHAKDKKQTQLQIYYPFHKVVCRSCQRVLLWNFSHEWREKTQQQMNPRDKPSALTIITQLNCRLSPGMVTNVPRMGFVRLKRVERGAFIPLVDMAYSRHRPPPTVAVLLRAKCTMQSKHLWEWMTYTKGSWRLYVDERRKGRKIIGKRIQHDEQARL